MEQKKKQGGLLAKLQILSGCQYLSDLHNSLYIEDVLYALKKINMASYSMDEWTEAYSYITGQAAPDGSKESLVSGLAEWLEGI